MDQALVRLALIRLGMDLQSCDRRRAELLEVIRTLKDSVRRRRLNMACCLIQIEKEKVNARIDDIKAHGTGGVMRGLFCHPAFLEWVQPAHRLPPGLNIEPFCGEFLPPEPCSAPPGLETPCLSAPPGLEKPYFSVPPGFEKPLSAPPGLEKPYFSVPPGFEKPLSAPSEFKKPCVSVPPGLEKPLSAPPGLEKSGLDGAHSRKAGKSLRNHRFTSFQ